MVVDVKSLVICECASRDLVGLPFSLSVLCGMIPISYGALFAISKIESRLNQYTLSLSIRENVLPRHEYRYDSIQNAEILRFL